METQSKSEINAGVLCFDLEMFYAPWPHVGRCRRAALVSNSCVMMCGACPAPAVFVKFFVPLHLGGERFLN
jgi:hypothetical protein